MAEYKIISKYENKEIVHTYYVSLVTGLDKRRGFFRSVLNARIRVGHESILRKHPKLTLTTIIEGVEQELFEVPKEVTA